VQFVSAAAVVAMIFEVRLEWIMGMIVPQKVVFRYFIVEQIG